MGRGLSPLQKTILTLAFANRTSGNSYLNRDLYKPEILINVWGWQPSRSNLFCTREAVDVDYVRRHPFGQLFCKSDIGSAQYNSAHASISRACRRLLRRGLILEGLGVTLTESGVKVASAAALPFEESRK